MTDEFEDLDRRFERSITRIPDRFSTPSGEALRREWAEQMAAVMGGSLESNPNRSLGVVPVHPHCWTDPVLIGLPLMGFVVLDHPVNLGWFEDHMRLHGRVAVHDCPRWWSLYEARAPRLVACPVDRKVIQLSDLCNRLTAIGWHGPWEAPPRWERHGRVDRPAPAHWVEQVARGEHAV